jgi:DNA polymerase III delta subunit
VRALELTEAFLEEGEEAPVLLGAVFRSVRQMRAIRALAERRVPHSEIAARLGMGGIAFKLPQLVDAARRWSEHDLRRAVAVQALGRADRQLKTGADAAVTLQAALLEACGRGESRAAPRRGR